MGRRGLVVKSKLLLLLENECCSYGMSHNGHLFEIQAPQNMLSRKYQTKDVFKFHSTGLPALRDF